MESYYSVMCDSPEGKRNYIPIESTHTYLTNTHAVVLPNNTQQTLINTHAHPRHTDHTAHIHKHAKGIMEFD